MKKARKGCFRRVLPIIIRSFNDEDRKPRSAGRIVLEVAVVLAKELRADRGSLDALVSLCLKSSALIYDYSYQAIDFAELGASRMAKEQILNYAIRNGSFLLARQALDLLNRQFSADEARRLADRITEKKCSHSFDREDADLENVKELARFMPSRAGQAAIAGMESKIHILQTSNA